jgi:hypothetical protein
VHERNGWEPDLRITSISHPNASGTVDSPKFGGIRVEVGPVGYVLQNGEKVML